MLPCHPAPCAAGCAAPALRVDAGFNAAEERAQDSLHGQRTYSPMLRWHMLQTCISFYYQPWPCRGVCRSSACLKLGGRALRLAHCIYGHCLGGVRALLDVGVIRLGGKLLKVKWPHSLPMRACCQHPCAARCHAALWQHDHAACPTCCAPSARRSSGAGSAGGCAPAHMTVCESRDISCPSACRFPRAQTRGMQECTTPDSPRAAASQP